MDTVITICVLGALYMLPTFVAHQRKHNVNGVLIINILTGGTVIGWFAALVMACGAKHEPVAPPPLYNTETGERLHQG